MSYYLYSKRPTSRRVQLPPRATSPGGGMLWTVRLRGVPGPETRRPPILFFSANLLTKRGQILMLSNPLLPLLSAQGKTTLTLSRPVPPSPPGWTKTPCPRPLRTTHGRDGLGLGVMETVPYARRLQGSLCRVVGIGSTPSVPPLVTRRRNPIWWESYAPSPRAWRRPSA